MTDRTEFRRQIRDALAHLHDPALLERHPLIPQLLETRPSDRLTRAQMLRGLLKDAVEALHPPDGSLATNPGTRCYMALHYRYLQGMSFLATQNELGVSRRQLQRELSKGVDAVAAVLWERRQAAPEPAQAKDEAADVRSLAQELENWELQRQDCDLQALIQEACSTLKPLLARLEVNLRVDDLPPTRVFVDPVLARQALFKALRLLVQTSGGREVRLSAKPAAEALAVVLEGYGASIDEAGSDWQAVGLVLNQQGGTLRQERGAEGAFLVVISLPLARCARVLVIDDTEAVHRLFARYLAPHNYEVTGSRGGPAALRLAANLQPDLITLDVMLPGMDGWQLLRDLLSNPQTAAIPVVVCSVLNEPDLALALGARAFVKKPVGRLELLSALTAARSPAPPEQEAPGAAPAGN